MPTAIPNFFRAQSPLGAAFANLASTIASGPTEAERYQAADNALLTHRKVQGQQGLADFFRNVYGQQPQATPPAVEVPQAPAMPEPVNDGGMPVGAPAVPTPNAGTPIAQAFAAGAPPPDAVPVTAPKMPGPNWGEGIADAIYGGIDPKTLGGYNLFGAANQFGARDERTQNAQVGAGQDYGTTYDAFDRKQTDAVAMNDADNATSRDNNAATNATSRENNRETNAVRRDIANDRLHNEQAVADATNGNWTPAAIDYAADIYRRTGQMPPMGMGRGAAAVRGRIIGRAAERDMAEGRTGADAAAQFAAYQGERAGQRAAGTREASASMAVNELSNLIPVAKEAFANVTRTGFVPADTLLQAYQNGTNDPDLNRAAVAVNDVINAHARAINPNGQVTDAGRAQGYQLLSTAKDQTAFDAILDQMAVGAAAALKSPGQTREHMRGAASAPLPPHGAPAESAPDDAAPAEEHWVRGPDGKLQRAR